MSARVDSAPVRGSFPASIVIAIIVALGIGAAAGALVTKAVEDSPAAVATSDGAAPWDAQKLEAMQGRALAERFRSAAPLTWDAQKLEAMEGRAMAEQIRIDATAPIVVTAKPSSTRPPVQVQGWDAYKLEAMEGRVLAAQVGAEDPPVRPHPPTQAPKR
jgi:hypothetical protein